MTHLEKIAHDIENNVYQDALHGKIARFNFEYGVAQATLKAEHILDELLKNYDFGYDIANRKLFIAKFRERIKNED